MAQKLIVVKYGGSVLEDGAAFRKASKAVKEEHDSGVKVVVVVSALKGVTDRLLAAARANSIACPASIGALLQFYSLSCIYRFYLFFFTTFHILYYN